MFIEEIDPYSDIHTYLGDIDQHNTDENPSDENSSRSTIVKSTSRTDEETSTNTTTYGSYE